MNYPMKLPKTKFTKYVLLLFGLLAGLNWLSAKQEVPKYINFLNDYADVLEPSEERMLDRLLSDFQDSVRVSKYECFENVITEQKQKQ